jgi:hypothetical protein
MSVVWLQDAGVYHDSGTNPYRVSEFHFTQLSIVGQNDRPGLQFDLENFFYESDIDKFISSSYKSKLAGFHVSFPAEHGWVERFHKVYPHADHCVIFCSELHESTINQLLALDLPRVTMFLAGQLNLKFNNAMVHKWMDWFHTSNYFYKEIQPNFLNEKLTPHQNKPKYFDILLGCQRTHRDFVYNYIIENNLKDKNIITYHKRWNIDLRQSDEFISEYDGVEFIETPQHTIHQVNYYGYRMTLSQVIPLTVYNQTYYTLIAETNAVNHFNFYTEKTVKPLIAGRLIIAIAGQYYLKNLKSFGFRTFDNVIDESYDNEPDQNIRWTRALDQLKYLCTQDPVEVYAKIKDAVEHNRRLIVEKDWYNDFRQQLNSVIGHTTAD